MKKIFLTGASAGIGRVAAGQLTGRGHQVWGTARSLDRLPAFPGFHPVVLDLTDRNSLRQGYAQALQEAGSFDVVINNAGFGVYAPLENLPEEQLRAQFEALFFGPLEMIRLALPEMRRQGGGKIINVTSLAAQFPIPFLSGYSAAKAALSSATEALRLESGRSPVEFIDLQPGDIHTCFHESTQRAVSSTDAVYEPGLSRAWETIDKNMAAAPEPGVVATAIVRLVEQGRSAPVVAVGDFFQAVVAPLLTRLAPRAWVQWGQKVFYRI